MSGLSCPTRDGRISHDGCAFCDEKGSASFLGLTHPGTSGGIAEQLRQLKPAVRDRFGVKSFLAYFQSYTNTYAPPEQLRLLYQEALSVPGIRGLCIGTRPDCLGDEVLDLLEEFGKTTYVSLELGIQSFETPVLQWLERGHDGPAAETALSRISEHSPSVHVCVHLIFGTPIEDPDAPRAASQTLNRYPIAGAKLHQLMILDGSRLAERWKAQPFPLLTPEQYAERVGLFLNELRPDIYLERLHATATDWSKCLGPDWSCSRWASHNRLRDHLTRLGVRQGKNLG